MDLTPNLVLLISELKGTTLGALLYNSDYDLPLVCRGFQVRIISLCDMRECVEEVTLESDLYGWLEFKLSKTKGTANSFKKNPEDKRHE